MGGRGKAGEGKERMQEGGVKEADNCAQEKRTEKKKKEKSREGKGIWGGLKERERYGKEGDRGKGRRGGPRNVERYGGRREAQ